MWIRKFEYDYLTNSLENKDRYIKIIEKGFNDSQECFWKLFDDFNNYKKEVEDESKEKLKTFANHCYNMATMFLLDGKVVESELAMRLYEQYK